MLCLCGAIISLKALHNVDLLCLHFCTELGLFGPGNTNERGSMTVIENLLLRVDRKHTDADSSLFARVQIRSKARPDPLLTIFDNKTFARPKRLTIPLVPDKMKHQTINKNSSTHAIIISVLVFVTVIALVQMNHYRNSTESVTNRFNNSTIIVVDSSQQKKEGEQYVKFIPYPHNTLGAGTDVQCQWVSRNLTTSEISSMISLSKMLLKRVYASQLKWTRQLTSLVLWRLDSVLAGK